MAKRKAAATTSTAAPRATWSPSPSPSPPPDDSPLELNDAERLKLLANHPGLKPSSLPSALASNGKNGNSTLVVLSPEELQERVEREAVEWEGEDSAFERDEIALWEELVNALLWTIPFGFLYAGLDYAVHAQFGVPLKPTEEFWRLCNIVPTIYFLSFIVSRPKPVIPEPLLQGILVLTSTLSGLQLIKVTTQAPYLKVMRQAPALGVIWIWTVVKMDLAVALLGLGGVAVSVWWIGLWDQVKWW